MYKKMNRLVNPSFRRSIHTSIVRHADTATTTTKPVPVVVQQPPPPSQSTKPASSEKASSESSSSTSKTTSTRRGGSRLRSLGWFSFGFALSAGLGSYKLSQDLWNSAHAVEHVVTSIQPEIRMLEKAINNKLQEVDQRLQKLESSTQSKK